MREVAPGDIIFSFVDTRIVAIGIATSYCWESPKPLEFGSAGQNWENVGWRVRVSFTPLINRVRPKDHMDVLRPVLPDRYSPLQPNGNAVQSIYSDPGLSAELAGVLAGLIGVDAAVGCGQNRFELAVQSRHKNLLASFPGNSRWEAPSGACQIVVLWRLVFLTVPPVYRPCGWTSDQR